MKNAIKHNTNVVPFPGTGEPIEPNNWLKELSVGTVFAAASKEGGWHSVYVFSILFHGLKVTKILERDIPRTNPSWVNSEKFSKNFNLLEILIEGGTS